MFKIISIKKNNGLFISNIIFLFFLFIDYSYVKAEICVTMDCFVEKHKALNKIESDKRAQQVS